MKLTHQSTDDQILTAHRDQSIEPSTSENQLMTVGTGGLGLWERHWQHYSPAKHPGAHRAMRFVEDISRHAEISIINFSMHHYRLTPGGIQQAKQFNQHLPEDLRIPLSEPPNLLVLQRRVMRKHAQVFFFSYGPFIMGDSHSFVASFKIRPRVTL